MIEKFILAANPSNYSFFSQSIHINEKKFDIKSLALSNN